MKRQRRTMLVGIAAASAAVAGGAWWLKRRPIPAVVRIGVGQPLSGGLAGLGQDMVNGARFAADEINAAGEMRINRQPVRLEIVVADDRADAAAGKAAAAQLVAQDIVAAIAHLNSGVSIAAAPVYAEAGVPQLAISTKPQYTQLGLPTTLRLVANDDMQARAIGRLAADLQGAERFAVVDDATPYGSALAAGAADVLAKLGKPIVLRQSLDDKRTDFAALVAALQAAGANALVTTLSDFQLIALMPQLAAAGLKEMQIVGGDTIKTSRMAQADMPVRTLLATSPIVDAKDFPAGGRFVQEYRRRFKTDPVYGAHYAYDAVHLVADALRRNGSVDRRELLARLQDFDGNCPVTNSMRFTRGGEQKFGVVSAYQLERRGWNTLYRTDQW